MKRNSIAAVTAGLASIVAGGVALPASAGNYTIDPSHSFTYFEVNHLGLSNYRGRFDKTSGKVMLDRQKKQGSIEITIAKAKAISGHHGFTGVARCTWPPCACSIGMEAP